jgi:hypothetical protein
LPVAGYTKQAGMLLALRIPAIGPTGRDLN